jgi:hypothetical protein
MSMTKVYRPLFIKGTTSRSSISCGCWNSGGRNAWAIRRDSSERSSSTMASEALCNSCELLRAIIITAKENE